MEKLGVLQVCDVCIIPGSGSQPVFVKIANLERIMVLDPSLEEIHFTIIVGIVLAFDI